jgi:hypothetical protein
MCKGSYAKVVLAIKVETNPHEIDVYVLGI